ncbi:MAG TPA: glycosyltransferase [Candidatus Binataceae bacterium]
MSPSTIASHPISAHGKFLSRSGQKFFFKAMRLAGVTSTLDFGQKIKLRRRLDHLKQAHTTGLVLSEAQSQPALDIAAQAGLVALIELEVAPEELLEREKWLCAISRVAHAANILCNHPAVLGFLIDCPISQDAIRAYGLEKIRRRARRLIAEIKVRAPQTLAAIKHRPETRALALIEEDFIYGEIPPLEPVELRDFVVSLHNIAEARPVVIEFAQTSPGQDEAVGVAFGTGAAGVVAPPIPAPLSTDWLSIRMLQASELMPFVTLNGSCPPGTPETPMVSVVICAYNAERTMRPCMESLRRLAYPNLEVIVVDDGSRDRTAEIAMDFPEFRLIRQPNKGLSLARNVGLHAARGDIIAYTDSDCVVDPHWLTFMIRTMTEGGFDGCGGPNYAPHEEGRTEGCVAASPGAPCHVLIGEDIAEHLAGCNMVFKKSALLKLGGFDPVFTAAGDDVDICWRMLDAGLKLGYSPAAFVWHFRRNTIKAYYGQQRGYGRAEALLYPHYPERFNGLGQIRWRGTIPGLARTIPGGSRKRVFWGAPRAGLQTVFDPALRVAKFLPQTLEWTVFWSLAMVVSFAIGFSIIPAIAMLALGPIWALHYAAHAPLEKCHDNFASRMLIAYLAYTGPMIRTTTRMKTRANARQLKAADSDVRQRPTISWLRPSVRLAYWNEQYITRDSLLDKILKTFARDGHPSMVDGGWNDFDIEVRVSPWTRVEFKTADEEHEGAKLKNHVLARVRPNAGSLIGLAAGLTGAGAAALCGLPGFSLALLAITSASAIFVAAEMIETGRLVYHAVEQCAAELNLFPLGEPVGKPRTARARQPELTKPLAAREMTAATGRSADRI